MDRKKPFIPASARHDRVAAASRVVVSKAVRDLIATGINAADDAKRDGKQGALDGTPNLAFGGVIAVMDDGDGGGGGAPPGGKNTTEKSTDKQGKEGKDDKEGKEGKESSEKGKDSKDSDEAGKSAADNEFGFFRYGRPALIDSQRLEAAVMAHSARGLAKGLMV
jgi:hypothetical protein